MWKEDNLEDFYEDAKVEGVGEMAGWPHHKSIEESKRILESFINEQDVYALYYKQNQKVIGSLGVHDRDKVDGFGENQKEIGYVLSKDYWNQGIMTEAVKEVIKYCFEELNIDTLFVGHFDFNVQSKRVIEKCGFKYYDTFEKHSNRLNKTFTVLRYYLTKEDYLLKK